MAFLAFLVAVVLIVVAIRGTQGTLFAALMQDVPGFAIWGAAIFALALIGFVPGLKPVSRGLLALVILVIVLHNYKSVLASFQGLTANPTGQAGGQAGGGSSGGTAAGKGVADLFNGVTNAAGSAASAASSAETVINGFSTLSAWGG